MTSVWRLWVVFLKHGGGALGIFKSPVCTYNQAWAFSLSASHYFSFLSKPSGRRGVCRPRSEAPCIYLDFFSGRARLAPPWPLTNSHVNTASFFYSPDLSSFSFLSTTFFVLFSFSLYKHTSLDLFSERARLAPPWPLRSSRLSTASVYYLRDRSSFSLLSTLLL